MHFFRTAIPASAMVASAHERRKPVAKRRTIRTEGRDKKLSFEELLDQLIKNCMDALEEKKLEVTIADLIKMRELREELAPTQPVKAEVTWIDGWD